MLNNFLDRIKLPFRKETELYLSLYQIIGFYPHDIKLYKMALMHKSVMHRNDKGKPINNERLELLGDAILDAIVGDIVYQHFSGKLEGFLTNTRSKLVHRDTLNKLSKERRIDQLVLSSGHSSSHNSYLGGNAFEALVGAMYLDRGYDACMKFMKDRILAKMINIDKVAYKEVNFKSKLIEWSQKNRVKLDFLLIGQNKDKNGSPMFKYQAVIEGIEGGVGEGFSKKESQQKASKLALDRLRQEPQYIDSVFSAKADRTKMEEEPIENVPETEEKEDFIISQKNDSSVEENTDTQDHISEEVFSDVSIPSKRRSPMYTSNKEEVTKNKKTEDEFDLSDISATSPQSKEDIIAAAEETAFLQK